MPGYPASGADGQVLIINHADPAAGANFILTFNTTTFPNQSGYVYELIRLRFQFATSATVIVRTVNLDQRVNAQPEWAHVPTVTQAQSLTYYYVFGVGYPTSAALGFNNRVLGPIPSLGWFFVVDDTMPGEIRTNIANLQAGDNITNIYGQYRISKQ